MDNRGSEQLTFWVLAPLKVSSQLVTSLLKPVFILVTLAIYPTTCYAYIDPNIGGWLFQLLFPVFVAIGGAWLVLKSRLVGIVRKFLRLKTRNL
jgi:hypothetical protein